MTLYRQKFIKCYINLVIYYRNIIISHIKDDHIVLISKLRISTGNLLSIITNIDSLFQDYYQKFVIALRKAKNNTLIILISANIMIYWDLTFYIILYALLRVDEQYNYLKNLQFLFSYI